MNDNVILRTANLCKFFFVRRRKDSFSLFPEKTTIKAVNEVDIEVRKGKITPSWGIRFGKTTLGYISPGFLNPPPSDLVSGEEITTSGPKIEGIPPQGADGLSGPGLFPESLPLHRIDPFSPLKIFEPMDKKERQKKVAKLLEAVHLPRKS